MISETPNKMSTDSAILLIMYFSIILYRIPPTRREAGPGDTPWSVYIKDTWAIMTVPYTVVTDYSAKESFQISAVGFQ